MQNYVTILDLPVLDAFSSVPRRGISLASISFFCGVPRKVPRDARKNRVQADGRSACLHKYRRYWRATLACAP